MPSLSQLQVSIAASFTAEPLEAVLKFWSGPLGIEIFPEFAPYGQTMQALLDPAGIFARNRQGLNVLLVRLCDLGDPSRREDNLTALVRAIETAAKRDAVPLLVAICPDPSASPEKIETLESRFRESPNTWVLPLQWLASRYLVRKVESPEGERLGQIPYTEDYFIALGSGIVRAAHALRHTPAKVLALDCDYTLWEGICGEDGPDGVRLGPGHEALQRFALEQRSQGMVLALVSKNNLADVEETFARNPGFPLRWADVTAHRINWLPKSEGLKSLARELSLGLDSFLFLDDNPREISEVEDQLPQVLSLCLPPEPLEFGTFLQHVWAFDRFRVTAADSTRAASYDQVREFGKALHEAHSLEEFYQSLELFVDIHPLRPEEEARAVQLTQRTNQFNFTTERMTDASLRESMADGWEVFSIHVRDRFGDYGFTGLLLGRAAGSTYTVRNFLLSCRVLGRGVEHAVFRFLAQRQELSGVESVRVSFRESAKNRPAREFLDSIGSVEEAWLGLPLVSLRALQYQPRSADLPVNNAEPAAGLEARHRVDYGYIATRLHTVDAIRSAMRASSGPAGQPRSLATATEAALAELWQSLLPSAVLTGESNFFALGGHSLLAVLLLVKIKERFDIELGIDDVYASDVTLERMARRIEEQGAFGGLGHEEYHRLVQEIEAMSEAEVEAELDRELALNAHPAGR